MHSSIEKRVAGFRNYYEFANERPLLGFFVGSEYPLQRYKSSQALPEDRCLRPEDFEAAPYLDDCDRLFEEHERCGGDFIWSASAFWGIPWLEAAVGCSIFADHVSGSIRSQRPDEFGGPEQVPGFDPASPWVVKASELIDAMAQHSKRRWPIGTTRMRGIADLLAALYGGEEFVFAMIERPVHVKAVCEKITDFWIEFGRVQLEHIPLFHGGIGSFYYNMWVPSGTVWHQEDAAALLSPSLYEEFIFPCDMRIVEAFDGCIMHQHPTGFVPTDFYLKMPFIALELHIDKGGPDAQALYDTHIRILEQTPLLIWGELSEKDMDWIFTKLPAPGLAVMTVVDRPERAAQIWKRYIG